MSADAAMAPWLRPAELAAKLRVSKTTIIQWTHQGRIPAEVATGRIWRYDEAKVLAALKLAAEGMAK